MITRFYQPHKKWSTGFTLIELVVVISIIAVLSTIAIFGFRGAQASARDASRLQIIKGIRAGLTRYYGDFQRYPDRTGFANMIDTGGISYLCGYPTSWGQGSPCGLPAYLKAVPVDPNKSCTTRLGTGPGGSWIPCDPETKPLYNYEAPDGSNCHGTFPLEYQIRFVKESGPTVYFCSKP